MSNSTRTDTLVMQAIRVIKKTSMDRQKLATIILKNPAGL